MTQIQNRKEAAPSFDFDRAQPLDALRRLLVEYLEPEYQAFISKLLPGVDGVLGVRVPILRSLARKIAQDCGREFLNAVFNFSTFEIDLNDKTSQQKDKSCNFKSYEERLIVGFIAAEVSLDFERRLEAIAAFIPHIDSWAVCDSFSASLRIPNACRAKFWEFLEFCAQSSRPFEVRFAVVATLNHFLEKNYLDAVFERANQIAARRLGEYYVDMSLAWLVAEAFIRFPDATLKFLESNNFDDFTFNKSLQKIVESRRVEETTKDEIRRLKRPRRARRSNV